MGWLDAGGTISGDKPAPTLLTEASV
jgi:hypothetical protein